MYQKVLLLIVTIIIACANNENYTWVHSLPKPWTLSKKDFDFYLPLFQKKYPEFNSRLTALNLWRVGTPYGIFCLGEENGVDPDPIIRFDTSDCTVHVLTTIALAESFSWEQAKSEMINIHYKADENGNKKPTYKSRWHFTSDRLMYNPGTVDMTSRVVENEPLENINIELNKEKNGSQFLDLDWTSKENISYISTKFVDNSMLQRLPKVCGVAFVKESYFNKGIVVAHEGYIINKVNLIHASREQKKTVNVDFMAYLIDNGKPRFDGVIFYEIVERDIYEI